MDGRVLFENLIKENKSIKESIKHTLYFIRYNLLNLFLHLTHLNYWE